MLTRNTHTHTHINILPAVGLGFIYDIKLFTLSKLYREYREALDVAGNLSKENVF
jgi:hypothetical protein